jgi:hypothetical protein
MRKLALFTCLLIFLFSACSGGNSPTSTTTQITLSQPSATPTPAATPLPQALITVEKAPFYAGPDNLLFESLGNLGQGDAVEPLGIFGDYLKARATLDGTSRDGYLYAGWAAPLPSDLPQLTLADVPALSKNALAWQGWNFKYNDMTASIKDGILIGSSKTGYMTLFNEQNPIRLSQPLYIQVQAKGQGKITEITLAGRLQTSNSSDWWKGIRRLNIRIWNSNPKERLSISYNDGSNDSGVAAWDLIAMPVDGQFFLSFYDAAGTKFKITDSQGKMLTADGQACELPSDLFPDGVAYLGYNVAPGSNIEISKYIVLGQPSGKFTNAASTAKMALVFLAQDGILSRQIESLTSGKAVTLLGAAGQMAFIEWSADNATIKRGLVELAALEKVAVTPRPALIEMPWLVAQNGLLLDGWTREGVSWVLGNLLLQGGGDGASTTAEETFPYDEAFGLRLKLKAHGSSAGILLSSGENPDTPVVALWVEDGKSLVLRSEEHSLDAGKFSADSDLDLRLAGNTVRLTDAGGQVLAETEFPPAAFTSGIRISLSTDVNSSLEIKELSILASPSADYTAFLQQGAASITRPLPVITAENIDQVKRVKQWGKGQVWDIQWSPDGETILVLTRQDNAVDQIGSIFMTRKPFNFPCGMINHPINAGWASCRMDNPLPSPKV